MLQHQPVGQLGQSRRGEVIGERHTGLAALETLPVIAQAGEVVA
jgi:hypothetical protein